jgi:DNA repair exonuclease SbcCD ATPase subunit
MRLTHVRIRNILGIEELDFDAGAFTVIEGPNGKGKTSALEAIKSVAKGGEDATLLRNGATEGEIVWLFDEGTTVRKRVTEKSQTVTVEKDGKREPKAQTTIKGWLDMLSMNPVDFLRAEPKRRVNVMLESMPMQAETTRIQAIIGDATFEPVGDHALRQIDHARTTVYDDRTGTNRALKDKQSTISQLTATLPPERGPAGELETEESLVLRVQNIEALKAAEMKRIDDKLDGLRSDHDTAVAGYRAAIAELQAEIATTSQAFADIQSKASRQREISADRFNQELAPNVAALAAIRADREAAVRAKTTRETLAKLREEVEDLSADSARQTKAIADLDAYKSELLGALPISGLEVRDGEIYRNGVTFDRLNKAQQVEIAVEIAKKRAGELKLICVDDLEMLDSEHFAEFQAQAIASGLQLIVTRVSDGEFAVRAEG